MDKKDELDLFGEGFLCKLSINNIRVPVKNIQNISLREWIFDSICTLNITLLDTGTFIELSPLYDESPISLTIAKNDNSEMINLDFVLNNFEFERMNVDGGSLYAINLVALLKTNDFFYPQYSRYFDSLSSTEVIKNIATENDMNFKEHIKSNDTQHWYQIALTNYDMIKHIKKRAYIEQEDMPMIFLDRSNTLHYTSIKTMCRQTPKFIAYCDDMMAVDSGNDIATKNKLEKYKETNNRDFLFFRTGFTFKSIASSNNKDMGYGIDMTYFDHENFYRYIMNFKFAPLTKYANINKNNYNKLTQSLTFNTIHKNTHKNYLVANLQNEYIKRVFFNSYLQIIVAPNSNLELGDLIEVVIPDTTTEKITGTPGVDKVNSGLYIVGGIMHDIQKDGFYSLVLTLFRNGVNSSDVADKTFEMLEV